MQAEPHGVVQVNNILRIKNELLAWANFMCSSSVRYNQILDHIRHTDIIPSGSPVLGDGESREGVFGQGTTKHRIDVEQLLTML